jgi:hypothetical protein
MRRLEASFRENMEPFLEKEETATEKTFRLSGVMLSVAKEAAKIVPLGTYVPFLIRATEVGFRFGTMGLGAWILRQDVKEAVQVLVRLMGSIPGVRMGDVTGGLYYLFAVRRGERGCNPDVAKQEHATCPPVDPQLLIYYLKFAPAALHYAYQVVWHPSTALFPSREAQLPPRLQHHPPLVGFPTVLESIGTRLGRGC